MYKCINCGAEFDELPKGLVRCAKCSYKILLKTRDPVTKKLKAR